MPSFKEKAQVDIEQYIYTHSFWRSRYEIDKHLLSQGFEPEWIDESWQNEVKRQRWVNRYERIEKGIFLINIFLLIWFFKPNLPLFYEVQKNDIPNQTILVPFVLLFFLAIVLWYKYRPYARLAEGRRYFMTIVPIVPLLILFSISFAMNQHRPSREIYNITEGGSQYKSISGTDSDNASHYKCDNFGLLCFEVKH